MTSPQTTPTIGIDVGGANLKYATTDGRAHDRFFPMWTNWRDLKNEIATDLKGLSAKPTTRLAVTMTGELADCFADRKVGVDHIVDHVVIGAQAVGIHDVQFYGVDGKFHRCDDSKKIPDIIAAANWHALASYVASEIDDARFLIDIGSTTTDLISVADGKVTYSGQTDFDRLADGALVYVGGRRTPVCALIDQFPFRGNMVPTMNEFFATIDDARIVLGFQDEFAGDTDTADSQPRTIRHAINRLARMIGLDHRTFDVDDARAASQHIHAAAMDRISAKIPSLPGGRLVISGHCDDLISSNHQSVIRLSEVLGPSLSRSAPAYATALLADTQLT